MKRFVDVPFDRLKNALCRADNSQRPTQRIEGRRVSLAFGCRICLRLHLAGQSARDETHSEHA